MSVPHENSTRDNENFDVESKFAAFFTGNQIEWTADGAHLLCQHGDKVCILDVTTGQVTGTLSTGENVDEEIREDLVTALTESCSGEFIITSHRSGLLHMWNKDQQLVKSWKSVHKGPVVKLAVSNDGKWLATGGSDSSVRIWDLRNFNCIHCLRGCQGVISVLQFRPNEAEVFGAGDDCVIHGWELESSTARLTLSAHYSKVTALVFHVASQQMISCGRDSVVCIWNLVNGILVRTIPVYESLEAMVLLPTTFTLPGNLKITEKSGIHVATAGEKGIIKVWQIEKAKEIFVQSNSQVAASTEPGGLSVMNMLFNKSQNTLAVVSADHNIIFHRLDTFDCEKLLTGFCDEILDLAFVGVGETHLAVASNSPDIKIYRTSDMHCQLLRGHTDLVLSLATSRSSPCLLASAAKDNTVRLWILNQELGKATCVAVGERHTASVGAVVLTQLSTNWLLSAAQDECLKAWKLPQQLTDTNEEVTSLSTEFSERAHSKDINSICVSPNDKLVVTASQDKTAKLWSLEGLVMIGVLRGHTRGVWCARFSPTDQVIATGSADCTIRLWNISDLSCVKKMEGHDASVLRLEFLTSGSQILTAGGDGLVKLWTLKTSECITTLDAHEGRIWALTVRSDEKQLVTGAADSTIVMWRDTTVERREKERETQNEKLLGEQKLANLLHRKEYDTALELALKLNRPRNALKVVEGIIASGKDKLGPAISRLTTELQSLLVQFALTWNMNTRSYEPAQMILEYILSTGEVKLSAEDLAQAIAYTDKHLRRLSLLRSDMHFISYTVAQMNLFTKIVKNTS